MWPGGVVERRPVVDDPAGLEAVSDLLEINGLLLQASPQPFDEDVIQISATNIHRDAHANFGQRRDPGRSCEL